MASGKLIKWAIELGEFDIHFKPRLVKNEHAVADFFSEFTEPTPVASSQIIAKLAATSNLVPITAKGNFDLSEPLWTLHVDGSSNSQGYGAYLVLISLDKMVLEYALRFNFQTSNNVAEYEALLAGLQLAREMGTRLIQIFSDSQLVVHQVNYDFLTKDTSMTTYLQYTHQLLKNFNAYHIS